MRPPSWAERLLRWILPAADRETVVEDLAELHRHRLRRRGAGTANRWYRKQVMVFAWHLVREGRGGVATARSGLGLADGHTGGGGTVGQSMAELRNAARRLVRAPSFTAVAVLTVGIGIGAFTSIYALMDAVLVEEMPYEAPDELAWVWRDYYEASFPRGWLGGPDLAAMREDSDVFAGVVALRSGSVNLTGEEGTNPVEVDVHLASHGFFELLGVEMMRGRAFTPAEDEPGSPDVAVLSHRLWRSQFAGAEDVLGSTIYVDGAATEVVGITPEGFRFVKHSSLGDPVPADLYQPLRHDLASQSPGAGMYAGLVRIRPGTPEDRLEASLSRAIEPTNDYMAQFDASPVRLWTVGLEEDLVAEVRPALLALAGSAAFLLLILAANLATLLLGRAAARSQDVSIRVALGAARARVLTGVMGESALIAGVGCLLGLALASLGVELVVSIAPSDLPRLAAVGLDGSVVAVAVAVSGGMAVVAGVVPAVMALGSDVGAVLRAGGTRAGVSRGRVRTRGVLVATQVALSMMLLVGAGVTARAFASLLRQDPGFDPGSTLTFRVPLPESQYPEATDQRAFHDALAAEIGGLPGVASVGATTALPLTMETSQRGIRFLDTPVQGLEDDSPLIDWFRITPGYLEAAGLRLLAGRGFDARDADSTSFNILVDDVLAERFFPGGSVVGTRAEIFGDTAMVVGVVDQARLYTVHADDRGQVFVPFQRFPVEALSYAVRTERGEPAALVPAIRAALSRADASVPMAEVRTLGSIVDGALGQQRLSLLLIVAFALGSLLLASLGLYGVVNNAVIRRRQEIGVRMALGAGRSTVVRMVVGQGMRLAMLGGLVGLAGALGASGLLESVMVGVDGSSPGVYAAVLGVLLAIAWMASWLPARRATRIDPVAALSSD